MLAGGIQLAAGLLKTGRWFRAISPEVIHGMLAGIGVLIVINSFMWCLIVPLSTAGRRTSVRCGVRCLAGCFR